MSKNIFKSEKKGNADPNKKYIISHDMGTSSDKAVLVDFNGKVIASKAQPYNIYYPAPAFVEQDPAEYWDSVCKASREVVAEAGIAPEQVKGIVFSTQAMGIIPVDKDGRTLHNNITWVDGRAQKQADSIMKKFGGKAIFTLLSGTPITGKDVIAKLIWLKEERPNVYNDAKYFLDVNGFLKFKCTGEMVSELSGASSYGLDLKKKDWLSVLKLTGLDMSKLPPLVKSTDAIGNGLTKEAAEAMGLNPGTPVFGGCDDTQAATIGSGMNGDGDIHIYLGTSGWVCASSKNETKFKHGAAAIQSADPEMNEICGVTEAAGSNITWLIDQFFKPEKEKLGDGVYKYLDDIIRNIPAGSDHLICTPWMLGERCPVSSTTVRATLFNIDPSHTREHLMRALYEGIGYNLRWILENFEKDYGLHCRQFRIIGGGALDDAWMQIISDITQREFAVVENPRMAGAVGAAIIALIGLGELKSFADAKKFVTEAKTYRPNSANRAIYDELFATYKDLFKSLKRTYKNINTRRFEGLDD